MTAASIVNDRTYHPAMDTSRAEIDAQQAARAASIQAAERVKVAALLAAQTGNFQDIAEMLDLPYEVKR